MYFGALSAALLVLLAPATTVQATNYTDVDILNFALNLEVRTHQNIPGGEYCDILQIDASLRVFLRSPGPPNTQAPFGSSVFA